MSKLEKTMMWLAPVIVFVLMPMLGMFLAGALR